MNQQILAKILNYEQAGETARQLKSQGKKLVMVSGCFDLMHIGHMEFLSDAKALGDVLFISLGSDKTVKTLKGDKRPIMNEGYRAQMLASLQVVDFVVVANEEEVALPSGIDFNRLITIIRPDIFAINKGNRSVAEKQDLLASVGGRLAEIEGKQITSTTETVAKIEKLF